MQLLKRYLKPSCGTVLGTFIDFEFVSDTDQACMHAHDTVPT